MKYEVEIKYEVIRISLFRWIKQKNAKRYLQTSRIAKAACRRNY